MIGVGLVASLQRHFKQHENNGRSSLSKCWVPQRGREYGDRRRSVPDCIAIRGTEYDLPPQKTNSNKDESKPLPWIGARRSCRLTTRLMAGCHDLSGHRGAHAVGKMTGAFTCKEIEYSAL